MEYRHVAEYQADDDDAKRGLLVLAVTSPV
jgi:hypothetical protein